MRTPVAARATVFLIAIGLGLVGCTDDSKPNTAAGSSNAGNNADSSSLVKSVCSAVPRVEEVGTVQIDGLKKPTGLVASRTNEGLWWLNDGGEGGAKVWAMDSGGAVRAVITLKGVDPVSWEDNAVSVDSDGNETVYIADTGDLAGDRKNVVLYSFEAPDLSDTAKGSDPETTDITAKAQTFTYPDGAHDSKAMFIDPDEQEFYLITGDPGLQGKPGIYRGELSEGTDSPATLAKLEPFSTSAVPVITGADLSPDTQAIAIRAYGRSGIWQRTGRQVMAEVFAKDGCEAPAIDEVQGEGIGFSADGSYYLTISAAGTLSKVSPPG